MPHRSPLSGRVRRFFNRATRRAVAPFHAEQMEPRLLLASTPVAPPIAGNWGLAFNDNFTSINTNVWQNTYWWGGNAGTQATFDPSANSINANGLAITATEQGKTATTGAYNPYTSGVLTTGGLQGKKAPGFSFTYGYVETTCKVAPGQGMWSALWMLPTDHNDNCELDLMENLGRLPYNYNATYHWSGNYWQPPGNVSSDLTQGYHTYGVDWEPDHITWYFDGAPIGTFSNASAICNRAMYLILNLDVGGPWAGPLNGSQPYQSTWQIQDVRVWQHVSGGGDTTPPSTPGGLYNSGKTTTSATINWNASSDNVGVAGYNIFRNGTYIATVAGNQTYYTDSGLGSNTTYAYTVNAYDAASNTSAASGALYVTTNAGTVSAPTTPTGVYSSATTSNSVSVSWTASSDSVGVTGYNIFRNGAKVGSVAGNQTYFADTGLSAGTNYTYTVNAYNAAGGVSAASAPFYVTTTGGSVNAPTAPPSVWSSNTTSSMVAVSWLPSTDPTGVSGYNVFRNGVKIGSVPGNYTYLVDGAVSAGTTYTYTVNAYNAAGGVSAASAPFVVTTPGGAVGPTKVNLASAFNTTGIVNDGTTFSQTGGLGGSGTAFSAQTLGTSQTWNGNTYALGAAGASNVVSAYGQTVTLPQGNYSSLSFLATAEYGNQLNQNFTVHYTDGTSQTFSQSLSDWYNGSQGYAGESNAISVPYINYSSSYRDNRTFHVYGYRFALNASKTVQSITLPNNPQVQVLAIDLNP